MQTQISNNQNVIYEARPKQMLFHSASEMYKLYGGAMGGGKALTPDHEVLTANGWKFIPDIRVGDSVLSWDQQTEDADGCLRYAVVRGVFEQDHDGLVLEHENRPYFVATPNHRWIVSWDQSEKSRLSGKKLRWKWVRSTDLGAQILIPASGLPVSLMGQKWRSEELELWGWYIAEGCLSGTVGKSVFSQEKPAGVKRIAFLLESLHIPFSITKGAVIARWLPPIDCGKSCYDKFVPRDIMSERGLSHFVDGLIGGDGSMRRKGWEYYTASRQLADDVQEIATLLGLRASLYTKKTNYQPSLFYPKNGKGVVKLAINYRISAYPRKVWTLSPSKLNWRPYKGKTYCLWVPGPQTFFARYKGSAFVTGNTFALCAEGIALSYDYPGNRGYICRHELRSFKKTTHLVLNEMLEKGGLIERHHQTDNYYLLKNGSVIFYGGLGDDIRAIERLKSMELGWFAIDEASETTENFFFMLSSRLRLKLPGIKYFGLMGSNPDPGWLKLRFIDQKLADHIFIPALPTDNPDLPKGYIDRLEEIFPEDWQARFLKGDWTAWEGARNIFPYQDIQRAFERDVEPGEPKELGVDVARTGKNETVIALRRGGKVDILDRIRKSDLMFVAGRIIQRRNEFNPSAIKVDADGMGAGVVDRLREQDIEVVEIHGGSKANDSERFANQKAEIHWGFRERLIAGDVDLPSGDLDLQAQLTSIEHKTKSSGQFEIVSKEEMEKKGVVSPDIAEAVIYAFADVGGGDKEILWL